MKRYYKYAEDVLDGTVVACNNVKLACKRFKNYLNNPGYEFREEKVDRIIKFISLFKHYSGNTAGKQFILMDWQQFLIANIFGFYYKGTDKRVIQSCYLQISRKSGKSFLAAAISLYCLLADGEADAQILFTATSTEQASICFNQAKQLLKQIDNKGRLTQIKQKEILLKTTGKLKVLSSDADRLDGYSPSVAIIDEYHAHKTSAVRDVMISGMGARKNPLEIIITTAGFKLDAPCKELRDVCVEILQGIKEDETQFALIFELDDTDDWQNPEVWIKAAPCMGVTITESYITRMINKAINNASELLNVKTKVLNIWCDNIVSKWIAIEDVKKVSKSISFEEFRDSSVYIGVDLSAVSDLTAVSYLCVIDGVYKFKTQYFIPEKRYSTAEEKSIYDRALEQGELIVTKGNTVDYDYIIREINKVREIAYIQTIAYDKYNATQWAIDMQNENYNLLEFAQGLANFNRPTKELERLILSEQVEIDENKITKLCFYNAELKVDNNMNCKPIKGKDNTKKIDGTISMIQALGAYLLDNNMIPELYTI